MKTCCEYYFSDMLRVRSERFKKHMHVGAADVSGGAEEAQEADTGRMAGCARRFPKLADKLPGCSTTTKKPAAVAVCQQLACTARVLGCVQSAADFKNKVIRGLHKEMDSVTVGAMELGGEEAPENEGEDEDEDDEDEDEDEDGEEDKAGEEIHPLVSHPVLSQPPFLNSRQSKEIRRKFEEIDESHDGALDKGNS